MNMPFQTCKRFAVIVYIPYLSYLITKINNIRKMLNNTDRLIKVTVNVWML